MNPRLLLAGLLSVAPLAAPASTHISVGVTIGRPAPIIVREAPPVRVSEARPLSPGREFVWAEGHYSWRDGRWVWVPGMWVRPPKPGAVWVAPVWDSGSRSWTEGHWTIVQPRTPPPPVVMAAPPGGTTIVVTSPPPPPRREYRTHRPGRGYVWVSGHWTHRHGRYVWAPGYWVLPPRGHRHWIGPRWERRGGTYIYIEGRWR